MNMIREATMLHFYDLNGMPYKNKRDGVQIKAISGERTQMIFTRLASGFRSDHHHPEEQMGVVLSGTISLTIGGETRICEKGAGYYIPPDMPHAFSVTSIEHAEILDVFSPPKEDNKI
jgi:quercetin dioxygenase-like cupin family protein